MVNVYITYGYGTMVTSTLIERQDGIRWDEMEDNYVDVGINHKRMNGNKDIKLMRKLCCLLKEIHQMERRRMKLIVGRFIKCAN